MTSNEFEAFEVQPDKFKAVRNSFQYLFGYSPKLFEQHQQQQQNILVHLDKLVGISALLSHGHLCISSIVTFP